MDKQEAISIAFANLKGSKEKDLLLTAKALQFLRSLPEYDSNKKVGEAVGVSAETVREFLTLLHLPSEIQLMFANRQLRSLEQARRLWQLSRRRPEIVRETAEALAGFSAFDARDIIDHMLRNPGETAAAAKQTVIDSKPVIEHQYHVVAILDEQQYARIAEAAQKRGVRVTALVTSIVSSWLESEANDKRS